MFFIKTVDSNISEHLYEEENDIDEVSTPITTPSSESGHTYGIIRPEILATPSFTFNVTSSSDVIFLKYRFIYTHFFALLLFYNRIFQEMESVTDILNDLNNFVTRPARQKVQYNCKITRDRIGLDRGLFPTYFLHLEKNGRKVRLSRVFTHGYKIFLFYRHSFSGIFISGFLVSW